jgi:hypothetical protein
MPFAHDLAGGNGNLIATSIQSPNFDAETGAGWQIAKDGSATFYDISIPNVGKGTKVTFEAAPGPSDPKTGDVWYNTSAGLEANEWNGTEWVPFQISTGAIGSGAITTDLLDALAVTAAKIADETITSSQISATAGILGSQLDSAAGIESGQVAFTARDIDGITTTIAASAPASPNVGDLWIDSANGNVLNQWNGSAWTTLPVGTDAIQADAVTSALIAAGAALDNIGANGITSAYLAAGVALDNIGAGGLSSAYLAAGAAIGNLSPGDITSALLAAGAALSNVGPGGITATYIAADAIVAGAIAAGAVTAGTISAGAVDTAAIAADAVTASQIAANTITAGQIEAGTITATEIESGTITAALLAAGIVVAGIIDGTTVTGSTLENSTSNPKTSINPDGSMTITNAAGAVIFEVAPDGTETWFDASGNILMQQSPTGFLSIHDPAFLKFPSGATFEGQAAQTFATIAGTSPAQFIQLSVNGGKTNVTGAEDQVLITLNSAAANGSSNANMEFLQVGSGGAVHEYAYMDATGFNLTPGTVTAPQPGVTPAAMETWHQMTLTNGFSAGTNNSFTDAPSYAILPCNPYYGSGSGKCVAFRGTLTTPSSGTVIDVTFATLPSAYTPQNGPFSRVTVNNMGGGQAGHLELHANGNLQLSGNFTNSTSIDITGITFI